ncbi:MAG: hypothetical protein KDA57_14690 [Planctomycetales bacterium]|nr:hypothetical protein [Planctomycetales bacterium]
MFSILQDRFPVSYRSLAQVAKVVVLGGILACFGSNVFAEQPQSTDDSSDAAKKEKPASAGSHSLVLNYSDNKPDGKKSIAGSGEMIRFELPGDTGRVRAIKVHGTRYGYPQAPQEDIEVTLLSEDMAETLHTELVPYSLFKRLKQARWTFIPFKVPVELPKVFWVVLQFNAERTKGVYVSYDTSTKGAYSRIGNSEEDAKETDFGGDWMVQVLLAK